MSGNRMLNKVINIIEYLLIAYIIISSNSIFITMKYIDIDINYMILSVIEVLACLYLLNYFNKKKIKKAIINVIIYIIFIKIYEHSNNMFDNSFTIKFLFIVPLLYFIFEIQENHKEYIYKLSNKFFNLILILSILSLFFYILGSLLKIIPATGIVEIRFGTTRFIETYYYLHFNAQSYTLLGTSLERNTGIFPEAPVYSMLLIVALLLRLFKSDKEINKKEILKIIILLITIYTTISTKGIVFSSLIVIFKIISKNKVDGKKLKKMLPIFIVLIIVCMMFILEKINTESFRIRLDDYRATIIAWSNNPIFGNGFCNREVITKYMSDFRSDNLGLSNATFVLLSDGGIYLFILYFIPIIASIVISIKKRDFDHFMMTLIFILLFSTTSITYNIVSFIIIVIEYIYVIDNTYIKTKDKTLKQ